MPNVEFRDGERYVIDHVAAFMAGLETWTMTYEQAVHAAEQRLMKDRLERAQRALLDEHFRRTPTR